MDAAISTGSAPGVILATTTSLSIFSFISSPYEVPENPDVTIDTEKMGVEECVDQILRQLHPLFEETA